MPKRAIWDASMSRSWGVIDHDRVCTGGVDYQQLAASDFDVFNTNLVTDKHCIGQVDADTDNTGMSIDAIEVDALPGYMMPASELYIGSTKASNINLPVLNEHRISGGSAADAGLLSKQKQKKMERSFRQRKPTLRDEQPAGCPASETENWPPSQPIQVHGSTHGRANRT
ncbi:hypothetical protein K490DRAFT_57700 [Saccharata proteae CBS 121410]|uniref:Uncharacterized protein n=1 Tax=Saccharata proteae CBS 121410 TaxID=1314787 RepID=A0A9P4HR39_9PEZI|nr:hypothetical protein K490DRAFT_57700 [Saccharata proteae CBS 121410]